MSATMKVEIRGEPYTVTTNEFGWGVTNATSPINRIGRSYQVWRGDNARATKCSCPHHANTGVVCKHMVAVNEMMEANDAEVESWSLEHPTKPRLFRFAKMISGAIRYEKWEGGVRMFCLLLSREEAGRRWEHLWSIGYRKCGYLTAQTRVTK